MLFVVESIMCRRKTCRLFSLRCAYERLERELMEQGSLAAWTSSSSADAFICTMRRIRTAKSTSSAKIGCNGGIGFTRRICISSPKKYQKNYFGQAALIATDDQKLAACYGSSLEDS